MGVLGEGVGEGRPRRDVVPHSLENLAEDLVGRLGGEGGEDADEVEAAAQHGRELSGEEQDDAEADAAGHPLEGLAEAFDH